MNGHLLCWITWAEGSPNTAGTTVLRKTLNDFAIYSAIPSEKTLADTDAIIHNFVLPATYSGTIDIDIRVNGHINNTSHVSIVKEVIYAQNAFFI